MQVQHYLNLKQQVIDAGYESEVAWAESDRQCNSPDEFSREHAFVVCNSGMKAQIAQPIFERVWRRLNTGLAIDDSVFGNVAKRISIQYVFDNRKELFRVFRKLKDTEDKLTFLRTLPHIGPTTVYHLAKNFGVDCCKPDRHLTRIASASRETPEQLCERLSRATGDNLATVDMVIWRAANLGLV